ncbi:unnamed protein product [Prunus brigantina]
MKYIACYEATSHAVWLRNFIKNIKVVDLISRLIQIYNDNTAAVFHCMNNKTSFGLQHIDRKYLTVREKVADKLVRHLFVNGKLRFVKHLAFRKNMRQIQRQDFLGLSTIALWAEAEVRERHGRRYYGQNATWLQGPTPHLMNTLTT